MRCAESVADTPGVYLLDRTSDRDHNRSVLTFAGPADAVAVAMERRSPIAIERIDMNVHEGEHPRIGAVDVIPFVPLGDTTMDEAIELARTFGKQHRGALRPAGLPVRARPRTRPSARCSPTSAGPSSRASKS